MKFSLRVSSFNLAKSMSKKYLLSFRTIYHVLLSPVCESGEGCPGKPPCRGRHPIPGYRLTPNNWKHQYKETTKNR